jgi:hypothetical protein
MVLRPSELICLMLERAYFFSITPGNPPLVSNTQENIVSTKLFLQEQFTLSIHYSCAFMIFRLR